MKPKVLMMAVLFAGFAAIDRPSFAHHGGAAFDMSTPVVLKNAVITEFRLDQSPPAHQGGLQGRKGQRSAVDDGTGRYWWRLSSSAGPERRSSPETSSRCTSGRPRRAHWLDASTRSTSPTARPCVIARPAPTTAEEPTRASASKARVRLRSRPVCVNSCVRARRRGQSFPASLRACVRSFQSPSDRAKYGP